MPRFSSRNHLPIESNESLRTQPGTPQNALVFGGSGCACLDWNRRSCSRTQPCAEIAEIAKVLTVRAGVSSRQADTYSVSVLILAVVFVLTVVIGAVLAKGVLTLMLHLIVQGELPTLASLRIAGFLVALIAFWSMAPSLVDSSAAAGLLALVR